MKFKAALFLLFLAMALPQAFAQSTKPGSITTAGTDCSTATSCVTMNLLSSAGAVGVSITGTWAATLQFESCVGPVATLCSPTGAGWVAINGFPPNSSTGASSTTGNGTWRFAVSGTTNIRVRCSAYTSGTAVTNIQQSSTAASLNTGGGGGAGNPGGSDTQLQYNNAGSFGGAANGTFTSSTGVFGFSQKADGNDLLFGSRFTDTTPSGNFIHFQNAAKNADLYKVTAAGNPVLGAGGNISSSDTGAPGFTFSTNLETAIQPLAVASDGVHAAAIGLLGNTTVPSLTANSFHWLGPNSASFTAWGIQMASAENASAGYLKVGAAASHISAGTVGSIPAADIPATTITITTSSPTSVSSTLNSAFYYNQHATAGTANTYTLPTAAAGKQFCFKNSYNGSAADTGAITIATSASGQFIIDVDGTLGTTGGNIASGGAGGDGACVVGVDATHWQVYVQKGVWTKS